MSFQSINSLLSSKIEKWIRGWEKVCFRPMKVTDSFTTIYPRSARCQILGTQATAKTASKDRKWVSPKTRQAPGLGCLLSDWPPGGLPQLPTASSCKSPRPQRPAQSQAPSWREPAGLTLNIPALSAPGLPRGTPPVTKATREVLTLDPRAPPGPAPSQS